MESQLSRFERLVTALEQLAARTLVQLGNRDSAGALDCLNRADEIVADLATVSDELRRTGRLPQSHLERARALLAEHTRIRELINRELSTLLADLDQSDQARARLRLMKPAYGATHRNSSTLESTRCLDSSG